VTTVIFFTVSGLIKLRWQIGLTLKDNNIFLHYIFGLIKLDDNLD
jgi:hypothetical protein